MRTLKLTFVVLVVAWGLMALVVRSATPFIDDYRPALEQALSAQLDTPVSIGSMTARWYGLRPLIEFNSVRIGTAEQQLTIDRASLDVDANGLLGIFGSDMRAALLQASRLTITGVGLTLVREPDGRLHLEGIGALVKLPETASSSALPRSLRLIDTRLVWVDRKANTPPVTFANAAIALRRVDQRLELRARLDTSAGSIDAAAHLDGFLGTMDWSGQSYLHVSNLDVAQLVGAYLPRYYGLQSLDLNTTLWTRWQDARPVHSQGEFSIRQLQLQPTAAVARPLNIKAASAEISISRHDQRSLVGLKNLRVAAEQNWTARQVALAYQHDSTGVALDLRADYLPLSDLRRLALVRLPWPALRQALENLEPRGDLHDLRLQIDTRPTQPDWRVEARFERLGVNPWKHLPGIGNLSGALRGRQGLVQLSLNSADSTLQLQPFFRDTLDLDRVAGTLEFSWLNDAWALRTHQLDADAPHLRTVSRMQLTQKAGGARFLDLQTDFRDGDGRYASRYYPVGVMGDKTVDWLDRAILAGNVKRGSALFYGDLSAFPFEQNRTGNFEVLFDVDDVDLDYQPGWPMLEALSARVHFHGNQLDVSAHDGRVFASRISDVMAHIDSLKPASSIQIRGRVQGPLNDTLQTLRSDALRAQFGRFAAALQASGETTLDLDFALPLTAAGTPRLQGGLQFEHAGLMLPEWSFAIAEIDGRLGFSLDGIQAEAIEARAMNGKVRLDVRRLAGGSTRITANALLSAKDIAGQLPALPLHLADGKAAFQVDVDIPPGTNANNDPVLLSVESPLQGIAIALPAPLGKSARDARALSLRLPLASTSRAARLAYGDDVSANFSPDGSRVDVVFGGGQATRQDTPGVRVSGNFPTLDIAAWQKALAALGPRNDTALPPTEVDVNIGRLKFPSFAVDDASVTLRQHDGTWRGRVAATQLSGEFTIPASLPQQPVDVKLDRLLVSLPISADTTPPPPVPAPATAVDPTEWPGLTLTISDLQINNAALGRLTLDVQRDDAGLNLQQLALAGGALKLDGNGSWTRDAAGVQTRLAVDMETRALGDLLVDLGYARQLEESPGKIDVSVNWPGDPTQLHARTIRGDIALDIGGGRLAEVDPGVTRVVGLLNLNALTRRLRLDFSDFYKKGYSFDAIRGDFRLAGGKAVTENLVVEGPTGRIDLDGSADLIDESLDQHVRVTPDLDATLPIAGALAGGPVAGIAVLVAQQVLSDQVDEINRFEYAVSGPWTNPKIVQLDSGGTLSKIFKPLRKSPAVEDVPNGPAPPPSDRAASESPAASRSEPQATADPATSTTSRNPLRVLLDALQSGESTDETLPIDRD